MSKLNFIQRLKAPTPQFFKKLRKVGAWLTTASVIIIAANSQFHLNLPPVVDEIGKVVAYMGFTAASVSSFAVDQEKLDEKQQNS